jgi:hypothetical protein
MNDILKKFFLFLVIYTALFIVLVKIANLLNQPFASSAFAAKSLSALSWLTPIFISYDANRVFSNSGFNIFFPIINIIYAYGIYKLIIWIFSKFNKNKPLHDEK